VVPDNPRRTVRAAPEFSGNYAVEAPPEVAVQGTDGPAAVGTRPSPVGVAGALVRGVRPRQWIKNLLVFTAPAASGSLLRPEILGQTLAAFGLFCLVSGGVYLLNDVRDAPLDRLHPTKRRRPVASGALPVPVAVAAGIVLLAGSVTAAALLTRPALAVVLGSYAVISLSYSLFLKNQPVIDLAAVASGFVLRAVAGGAATDIRLSQWFLLVAAFGALFMVAGKRYAELVALGEAAGTRKTLGEYSASYLRFVWSLSAGVTCTAYCLWAFELLRSGATGVPWPTISIAPFVLALLRYAVDVDRGTAGAPEDIVLRDRVLLGLGVIWAATFALGVLTR
jgi:decaprenyl-phosphate phosphoribosyltransferase